jgi:hypothetical protein
LHSLEQTDFGVKVVVQGTLDEAEVSVLKAEFAIMVAEQSGPFSLLVDATELVPPKESSLTLLQDCEELALSGGMQRMAIILKSPVLKAQVKQVGHHSGTVNVTQYVDALRTPNFEQVALAWVVDGVEPAPDALKSLES